jgi:hypothetical protein
VLTWQQSGTEGGQVKGKDIHDTETGTNEVYHISKDADKEAFVQIQGEVEYKMKLKDNGRVNETSTTL